jgi:magnesium transporter
VPSALLFERDRVDEVDDWPSLVDHVGRRSILWIDLDRRDPDQLESTSESLDLTAKSVEQLRGDDLRPYFADCGGYLHVTAFAPPRQSQSGGDDPLKVDCLVSERWVLTVHDAPVGALEEFREKMTSSSGDIGRLEGPEFLADLLAWVLEAYLAEFEVIELELEKFDQRVMTGNSDDTESEIENLVALRARIGRLRRALVSHRSMFVALAQPELETITSSDHAPRFRTLRGQLEQVVQVARDAREAVFGSFDVLIARTEHRTNEIMKVLTLGALLFLPGALIAGLLGMNFRVSIFETAWYFWLVCAIVAVLGVATLTFARLRRWI